MIACNFSICPNRTTRDRARGAAMEDAVQTGERTSSEAKARRVLLGMLTPSSNTILEPVTSAMLSDLPEVTAHFGRSRVTEISLSQSALSQFDNAPLLD